MFLYLFLTFYHFLLYSTGAAWFASGGKSQLILSFLCKNKNANLGSRSVPGAAICAAPGTLRILAPKKHFVLFEKRRPKHKCLGKNNRNPKINKSATKKYGENKSKQGGQAPTASPWCQAQAINKKNMDFLKLCYCGNPASPPTAQSH